MSRRNFIICSVDLINNYSLLLQSDKCVALEITRPGKGDIMRYVLLIYGSEDDAARMTGEERVAFMQGHAMFANEAVTRGILTGGAPLQPTSTATTVRVRNGKTLITDGPFAETKEQLAGTYVLDCKDLDEAIEMAAKIPDALSGSVEIRPVREL